MSGVEPLTFWYYEQPEPPPDAPEAGVQTGWVVLWSGEPGPAQVAEAAMLHDGKGEFDVVLKGEFAECQVVNDLDDA